MHKKKAGAVRACPLFRGLPFETEDRKKTILNKGLFLIWSPLLDLLRVRTIVATNTV